MNIVEGEVKEMGAGTWQAMAGGEGLTTYSVFEIGDHHLRRCSLSNYLVNYVKVGTQARLLLYKPFAAGLTVVAAKVGGKTYKADNIRLIIIGYWLVFSLFVGSALFAISVWLGVIALLGFAANYGKQLFDYETF